MDRFYDENIPLSGLYNERMCDNEKQVKYSKRKKLREKEAFVFVLFIQIRGINIDDYMLAYDILCVDDRVKNI